MPWRRRPGATATPASRRPTLTCSRNPDGRLPSSGARSGAACSRSTTGQKRSKKLPKIPLDDEGLLYDLIDRLGHDLDPSILIGGWATFELVGGEISKDIDLIIFSDEVRAKIELRVSDLSKSDHHQGRKWRGIVDGIHIAIYLPYESQLGNKLRLRVETLAEHTETAFRLIAEKSGANKADRRDLDRLRREWVDAAQVSIDPNRSQRERPTLT